ncbi:MAG: ABC transporter permease [Chloroflexota bacterium]
MIADIVTIVGKELKEILNARGNRRGGIVSILIFAGMFGIYLPLMTGPDWVQTPASLFYWIWLPFLMVSGVIADSIAGERERHTLETLLASRLSDTAILLGKVGAAIVYAWGLTIGIILISVVSVNLAFGLRDGTFYVYSPMAILATLVFSLLIALFSAGLGILVSLRAETVRQAQQVVSVGFMVIFIPVLLLAQFLPQETVAKLIVWAETANWTLVGIIAAVIFAALDAVLLSLSKARFQRSKLILD